MLLDERWLLSSTHALSNDDDDDDDDLKTLACHRFSGVFDDDGDQMPSRSADTAGLSGLPSDLPVPGAFSRSRLQRFPRLALRSSVHGLLAERYSTLCHLSISNLRWMNLDRLK